MTRRKSGRQPRPLKFKRVDHPLMAQPCIEVVSHARDRKGYIRIRPRNGKRAPHVNVHRLAYMSKHGPQSIPEGWEIDHICQNRACVNRSHLRALSRSDHKRVTNALRYEARLEEAHCYWLATGCTGTALAERFGVSPSCGCLWIRKWKANPDD